MRSTVLKKVKTDRNRKFKFSQLFAGCSESYISIYTILFFTLNLFLDIFPIQHPKFLFGFKIAQHSSTYKQSRPGVQKPAKMAAGKTLIKTISASSSGTNLYQLLLLLLKEETLEMFPKEDSCAGLSAFTCGFSSTKKPNYFWFWNCRFGIQSAMQFGL